jgi:hypothetical protein
MAEIVPLPVYEGEYGGLSEQELERFRVTPLTGRTWRQPVILCDTSHQPEPYDSCEGTGFVKGSRPSGSRSRADSGELDLRAQKADQPVLVLHAGITCRPGLPSQL